MELTDLFREALFGLYEELRHLDERVTHYDDKIARADERVQRLMTIPGIGPITATALLAAIGNIHAFTGTAGSWRPGSASCPDSTHGR